MGEAHECVWVDKYVFRCVSEWIDHKWIDTCMHRWMGDGWMHRYMSTDMGICIYRDMGG